MQTAAKLCPRCLWIEADSVKLRACTTMTRDEEWTLLPKVDGNKSTQSVTDPDMSVNTKNFKHSTVHVNASKSLEVLEMATDFLLKLNNLVRDFLKQADWHFGGTCEMPAD